jgi:hypothetical protein
MKVLVYVPAASGSPLAFTILSQNPDHTTDKDETGDHVQALGIM